MSPVTFRPLERGDEAAVAHAQRVMAREGFTFAFNLQPEQDFSAYLKRLEDVASGKSLRPGVAASSEVAILEGQIAGRLSVRQVHSA